MNAIVKASYRALLDRGTVALLDLDMYIKKVFETLHDIDFMTTQRQLNFMTTTTIDITSNQNTTKHSLRTTKDI